MNTNVISKIGKIKILLYDVKQQINIQISNKNKYSNISRFRVNFLLHINSIKKIANGTFAIHCIKNNIYFTSSP